MGIGDAITLVLSIWVRLTDYPHALVRMRDTPRHRFRRTVNQRLVCVDGLKRNNGHHNHRVLGVIFGAHSLVTM